jgi:hypothetical protein
LAASDVLPQFHHRERHALRVDASSEQALAAARAVTPADAPLLRLLYRARGLSVDPGAAVWEQMLRKGFEEVAPNTLVASGRPWRIRGELGAEGVSLAKLAMDFRAEGGELSTETRVWLDDGKARRRFRLYWLIVRPFSGLVRRSWLRAAKRRAESGA